jgi:hypothetical protein
VILLSYGWSPQARFPESTPAGVRAGRIICEVLEPVRSGKPDWAGCTVGVAARDFVEGWSARRAAGARPLYMLHADR